MWRYIRMIGFFIAILSGALMSVQGVFNTQVTKEAGVWVSNGWVQLSAFTACLLAWFVAGRDSVSALARVEPKYLLLGGVIGAGITWTVIKSMEQLGPAKAALLIVVSQLIVAYAIELMGMFGVEKEPIQWRKVIGMLIALIGVAIFQWK
jgi:transporter family-2 protein